MKLTQHAAATDPGRRRRRNEDAYVVQPPLFAVADGMGGAQAGEIASRIAASVLRDAGPGNDQDAVVALIQEANRRVFEAAAGDEARTGMGTTMTVALVKDGVVTFGHVGDSRAYRVRTGELEQLTDDHSLVAELVRSGKLSPEEADTHPQRSVITRVLGTDPEVDVDTFEVETQPGDLFMICSDGLTSMVDDATILALVEGSRSSLDQTARVLVDAANKGGGDDNITVVVFEIGEDDADTLTGLHVPVVPEPEPAQDDERTLTELDAVPALDDTVYVPRPTFDPPAAATGGRARREHRRISRAAIAAIAATGLVIVAALVVWTLSRSYFVGVQRDGHVAVYQGFPWNIVGGVRLYRVRYESPVLAGQLSEQERRRLFDHDLRTYGRALDALKQYEAEVVP
ncbi:MAG TPA: Stp1/IreP family PP2C-type Ser/Thr phosphatase [Gaiellaceae bacterium]|nr:Stp1/IreP family PP2C-type Ser/Thr phosphatase [Gaiellaceae bacterium]